MSMGDVRRVSCVMQADVSTAFVTAKCHSAQIDMDRRPTARDEYAEQRLFSCSQSRVMLVTS